MGSDCLNQRRKLLLPRTLGNSIYKQEIHVVWKALNLFIYFLSSAESLCYSIQSCIKNLLVTG